MNPKQQIIDKSLEQLAAEIEEKLNNIQRIVASALEICEKSNNLLNKKDETYFVQPL